MSFTAFFKLIRYKNLLIIILTQSLLKFVLLPKHAISGNLSISQFIILISATISIAAAGNIYNDILDVKSDTINNDSKRIINRLISIKTAFISYFILNLVGLTLGIYLCFVLDSPILIGFFLVPIILLYLYSKKLKSTVIIGNLAVSFLISLSILIIPIFESIPVNSNVFQIITSISVFAFLLNIVREIIKDIEDINGDLASNIKTLPIIFGRKRANKVALGFSYTLSMFLITLIVLGNKDLKVLKIYLILFVLTPLLYAISKLRIAKSKKDYSFLSNLLKIIMITGILSIFTL